MKIDKHPDYQAARDEYTGEIVAAKAAKDENAELRAELKWERRQQALRDDIETQMAAQLAIEQGRAALKEEFPRAPEEAYSHLGDLKAMRTVAEKVAAALPPDQPPVTGWPRPTGQGQPPAPERNKYNDPSYLQDLNRRVNKVGKGVPVGHNYERDAALDEVKDFTYNRIFERMREHSPRLGGE